MPRAVPTRVEIQERITALSHIAAGCDTKDPQHELLHMEITDLQDQLDRIPKPRKASSGG